MNSNKKKGGFFRWLRDAVHNVAEAAKPFLPSKFQPLMDTLMDATDGDGMFNVAGAVSSMWSAAPYMNNKTQELQIQDFPLSQEEENKLDFWVQARFMPIFKGYVLKINQFDKTPPTATEFVKYYNEIQKFISVLSWIKDNYPGDLTPNAVIARNAFIDAQIEVLSTLTGAYMEDVSVNANPVISVVTVNLSDYGMLIPGQTQPMQLQALQIKTNKQLLLNNNGTNINNTEPVLVSTQAPANSGSGKWWIWALALYGTYKIFKK